MTGLGKPRESGHVTTRSMLTFATKKLSTDAKLEEQKDGFRTFKKYSD